MWAAAKKVTNYLIKEAKEKFYKEAVAKLTSEGAGQIPYRIRKEMPS